MRNRRLLTLAVLAVALGISAYAQAQTAVVTLIQDANGAGSFDVRVKLWDAAGIGQSLDSAGLLDFAIKDVGGPTILTVANQSPYGTIQDANGTQGPAGFNDVNGIRSDGTSPTYRPMGLQGVITTDANSLTYAGVLSGVGTTGEQALPSGYSWVSADPGFTGDTRILSGTYDTGDANSGNAMTLDTFGPISFSMLPGAANTQYGFDGPVLDPNTLGASVGATVVQTIAGAAGYNGNNGGASSTTYATNFRVESGSVTLGSSYISGSNVTLQVSDPNVSVMVASDHDFGGLDLEPANAGSQRVNVGVARVNIAATDATDALNKASTIAALVDSDGLGTNNDGLYSSALTSVGSGGSETLVVTAVDSGSPGGSNFDKVSIKATLNGDINLDGTVDLTDYNIFLPNWQHATNGQWSEADLNGDGIVDLTDYNLFLPNWQHSFSGSPAPAVPEPATLSLLCVGAFGLLRRRRRS